MANMCRVLSHQITKTGVSKIPSLRSKNHSVSRLNVQTLKGVFFSGLVSSSSGVDHCLKDAALEGAQAVCKPQGENPQNGWGLNSGLNPLFFNG